MRENAPTTRDELRSYLNAMSVLERRDRARDYVDSLPISVRAYNLLIDVGASSPDELRLLGEAMLLRVPGLGRITAAQIGDLIGGWRR